MDFEQFKQQLATNAQTIKQLMTGVSAEQAQWKPDAHTWSILEVINHLYDEEQFDFRARVDYILHRPEETPPQIDPQAWVISQDYNSRELSASLENFLQEREKSLMWLVGLEAPNWDADFVAEWGSIKAGDIFAAWVAHDILHMRQLVELNFLWVKKQAAPYDVRYAGDW